MADDRNSTNRSVQEGLGPNGSINIDTIVQAYTQEYENIDQTLDEIDSWLTKLEEQNDSLSAELDELLESSRQARKELQEINKQKQEDEINKQTQEGEINIQKQKEEEKDEEKGDEQNETEENMDTNTEEDKTS